MKGKRVLFTIVADKLKRILVDTRGRIFGIFDYKRPLAIHQLKPSRSVWQPCVKGTMIDTNV